VAHRADAAGQPGVMTPAISLASSNTTSPHELAVLGLVDADVDDDGAPS
jgi:hypothetical protein